MSNSVLMSGTSHNSTTVINTGIISSIDESSAYQHELQYFLLEQSQKNVFRLVYMISVYLIFYLGLLAIVIFYSYEQTLLNLINFLLILNINYCLFSLKGVVYMLQILLLNRPILFCKACLIKYLPQSILFKYFGSFCLKYLICLDIFKLVN